MTLKSNRIYMVSVARAFGQAILAAMLLGSVCSSAAILPAYQFTGTVFTNLPFPNGQRIDFNNFGNFGFNNGFGNVNASAQGLPFPAIQVSADAANINTAAAFARSVGLLTYFMEVSGPQSSVPVQVRAAGNAIASATPGSTFVVQSSWTLLDDTLLRLAGTSINSGQVSGTFSQSFSDTVSVTLQTNRVYRIDILADAEAAPSVPGTLVSAQAFVDPIFSFAPGVDTSLFGLNFSAGIGNIVPTAGVPEPATFVLLGAGLLALGLLRARRA